MPPSSLDFASQMHVTPPAPTIPLILSTAATATDQQRAEALSSDSGASSLLLYSPLVLPGGHARRRPERSSTQLSTSSVSSVELASSPFYLPAHK